MLKSIYNIVFFSSALFLFTACGGSGEGLDENGQPAGEDPPPPLEATLSSIQVNVFETSCGVSGCHVQGTAAFGLRLDTLEMSMANLINVASGQSPSVLRVEPFDPDNSYLIQKLEGTGLASQMPLGRTALDPSVIAVIRQWIADGALLPTAASIQANLFNESCIECHSGDAPAGDLNLESGKSMDNIINVNRFAYDPSYPTRVIPGDADNSFLIKKLEGHLAEGEGVPMPLNAESISVENIEIVRQWINDGANR